MLHGTLQEVARLDTSPQQKLRQGPRRVAVLSSHEGQSHILAMSFKCSYPGLSEETIPIAGIGTGGQIAGVVAL